MGLVAESILGDNEHSNMDSDDLVPSLHLSLNLDHYCISPP